MLLANFLSKQLDLLVYQKTFTLSVQKSFLFPYVILCRVLNGRKKIAEFFFFTKFLSSSTFIIFMSSDMRFWMKKLFKTHWDKTQFYSPLIEFGPKCEFLPFLGKIWIFSAKIQNNILASFHLDRNCNFAPVCKNINISFFLVMYRM